MDILAWGILVVAYVLICVPIIGDQMNHDGFTGYKKAMGVGLLVHGFLATFSGILFAIVWAFNRVIS